VLAGVVLAACSASVAGTANIGTPAIATPGSSASASGSATASSPGTDDIGPIPAGLGTFYRQRLDWGSCAELATSDENKFYKAPSLQCADLTVPLSYDDPAGSTITLKVLRKPATDPANRIGSVVTNPGGPGASGVENAGAIGAYGLAKDINTRFDLVGFDPRGVGASTPQIQCQTDAERDASRAIARRTRDEADVDAANARAQQFAEGCAAMSGPPDGIDGSTFLANVGTTNVARDMDVLRAAIGDPKLTYVGWSYGTSIGTEYARQFPSNVRAMILDGAVDPNEDAAASAVNQAQGFQQAFDDFAAWCARQGTCPLGPGAADAGQATAAYQALVRPLLDKPLALPDGRVLSFDDANTGTGQALYSESYWKPLSDALTALGGGDGSKLMALADAYEQRDADGHYANILEAFTAIGCIDGSRSIDPAVAQQTAEKLAAAAPFADTGDPPAATNDPCDNRAATPVPLQPVTSVPAGLPQILVISTTHDPATPYEAGVNLAKALDARLLSVEGSSHTAYLGTGNACVDDIGNDYLITLTLPDDGTAC
jgi:pimeloyl-ACP methyl ester carboxylesterase